MVPLTLAEVADACGGRLDGADGSRRIEGVAIDSRRVEAGALFVALPGEHTDGHRFVEDAHARGAVAALVRDDAAAAAPAIRVADPLRALRDLAVRARGRLGATVIAVTGSSGKTGTKELIAAACARASATVASEASYNNEIGVPLTVLAADEDTRILVVEVGSRGPGHIRALLPVIRPDVAVITNVGAAHLGLFGSLETTARAKAELLEGLGPGGVAVLNADDPRVRGMTAASGARLVLAGLAKDAEVRATDVLLDQEARARFTVVAGDERAPVALRIPGEHMVGNAVLAIAAARAAGVPLRDAAAAVAVAEAPAWRMQIREGPRGTRIVNDAYNANPDSMMAALKTLAAMGRGRVTWAVLGPMAELGEQAVAEHDRIGRLAVRVGIHNVLTVGADARAIHEAARLEGMFGGEARFAATVDEAIAILREQLEPGAVVLVKASRAAGLERIAQALEGGS